MAEETELMLTDKDEPYAFGLTGNQQNFCDTVLANPNWSRTDCYMFAFQNCTSRSAAKVSASQLMRKEKVKRYLEMRRKELAEEAGIDTAQVLTEMAKIGFANIKDICEWEGESLRVKPSEEITRAQAAAISEISKIETKFGTTIRVKMHDKKGMLDTMAKVLGMVSEKAEVPVGGLEELLTAIAESADQSNTIGRIDKRYKDEQAVAAEVVAEEVVYVPVEEPNDEKPTDSAD